MRRLLAFVFPVLFLASCRSVPADTLITGQGVGGLTFGMDKPALKGYKASLESEYSESDDYTTEYWSFAKGRSGPAVVYWPDYRIDVFSPDFHTKEGLKAGDTFARAQEIYGNFNIYIPEGMGFVFEFVRYRLAFELGPDGMKGGHEAFNEWWLSPRPRGLTAADFEPEAKIIRIMVFKGQ